MKVFANRPPTLTAQKQHVAAYADEVTAKTRKKVTQKFCVYKKACFNRNRAHIKHVFEIKKVKNVSQKNFVNNKFFDFVLRQKRH